MNVGVPVRSGSEYSTPLQSGFSLIFHKDNALLGIKIQISGLFSYDLLYLILDRITYSSEKFLIGLYKHHPVEA